MAEVLWAYWLMGPRSPSSEAMNLVLGGPVGDAEKRLVAGWERYLYGKELGPWT